MVGTIRSPGAINMIHGNERREKVEQMKIQWMLNPQFLHFEERKYWEQEIK